MRFRSQLENYVSIVSISLPNYDDEVDCHRTKKNLIDYAIAEVMTLIRDVEIKQNFYFNSNSAQT
jgi:hypothetical protein